MFFCLHLRARWSLGWRIIFSLLYTLRIVTSKQCVYQNESIYHEEPVARYVDWSVQSDLCFSHQECYGRPGDVNFLPQLCPLELQPGDNLILLPPTNDFQAVYAANVSEASFLECSFQNISQDQKLTASPVSSPVQVPSNFLPAGQVAFFVQLPSSVFATCKFGLRLRVLVKSIDCRRSSRSELCGGRGDCVSRWLDTGYRCECTQNYTGQYCEEYNGCSVQPCNNGGTCVDLTLGNIDERFLCLCPEHLTGSTCREIEGGCDANHKCVNGICRNSSSDSHTCSCHEGFSGVFCGDNVDECSSGPCFNGATCVDRIAGYECVCEEHYVGVHCGGEKNYCDQQPCLNNGVCSPFFGGYNCTCATGFTGQNCSVNIDECASFPCQNNGTCQDQVNMFRCFCPSGYSGSLCGEDIDECSSSPCRNNGTCRDRVNGFTCECAQGWTGPLCDVDVLECSSDPCLNNGECHERNNGYTCNCLPDLFAGAHCEIPLHDCSFYPCQHNGTCNIVDDFTYSCSCPERYEGVNCEVYVPFCRENSCSVDSTCIEEESSYSCACSIGFQGQFCEINIDDCANVSCANGALCVDGVNEFLCACLSGFDGGYCEIDVNECASNPCTNGGTCLDLIDGYLCLCLAGYEGGVCEVDVDECGSMPCINGGSCIDGVNEFRCECGIGYNGTDCSLDVDLCSMDVCQNNSSCSEVQGGHDYSCLCVPGFTGRSCEVDIDECSSSPCQNDAICRDAAGAYQCYCLPGYVGDNCEFEINECFSSPCLHNSTCIDLNNNYSCVCQEGYEGFNCEVDVDECASHRCLRNATCVDEVNGYRCVCPRGYAGDLCEEELNECSSQPCNTNTAMCVDLLDGYQCFCLSGWAGPTCAMNIDECLSQPCFNGATCIDGVNEYSCRCVEGYGGSNCEVEIDECISEPCLHATSCVDTLAGYECICVAGYEGANCEININECASHPCNHNGTCFDLVNGFTCDCLPTYYGDDCSLLPCEVFQCENDGICRDARDDLGNHPLGFKCDCLSGFYGSRCDMNINECPENACSGNGFCLDGVNTYTCLCGPGWDGLDCSQPIDDCVDNLCQNNSTCMDLTESYECLCPDGLEGDLCERETNECSEDPCENGAPCIDLFDDYRCNCLPGWTGKNCSSDLDECSSNPCSNNATCLNQEGLFSCVCPPFYSGGLCDLTFDPCDITVNPCDNNATCVTQVNGTAMCSCQEGYEGIRCEVNVNECTSSPCLNGALCQDAVSGFICHCSAGFSGVFCEENVDDCFENACLNGGTCLDRVNSYTCECSGGWSGPNCTDDINECVPRPCQNGATCIDLLDSYQCICPLGYQGNDCEVDVDECLSQPCLNNGTCFDGIANVTCICVDGFTGALCDDNIDDCNPFPCNNGRCHNEIAGFSCSCHHGYTGSTCLEEIDECSSQPCLNGATCLDLVDSYRCVCNQGYRGVNCDFDIDVCNDTALNRSQCSNGGSCVDGPGGSFDCVCANGYSGEFCEVEMDECRSGPCRNGATCSDRVDGVTCSCLEGWTGEFCDVDLDECSSEPCQNGGICSTLPPPGGFLCFCPPGYQGVFCEVDYNECLSDPCLHRATCVDDVNLFRCVCPAGYSGVVCGDEINLCDTRPCRNNATCTFLGPGKYNCSCPDGFVGTDCGRENPCSLSPCGNGGTCQLSQESFSCVCRPGYHGDRCQSILTTLSPMSTNRVMTTRMPTFEMTPISSYTSVSSVGSKTNQMTPKTGSSLVTKTESSFSSAEYSSSKTMQFTSSGTSSRTDLAVSSSSGTFVISSSSTLPTEAKVTGGASSGPQSPGAISTTLDTAETELQTTARSSVSTPSERSDSATVTERTGVTQRTENNDTTMTALTDEGLSDIITTLPSGSSEELSVGSTSEQFSTDLFQTSSRTDLATYAPTGTDSNTELQTGEERTHISTAQNTDGVTATVKSLSTSTEGVPQTAVPSSSYQTPGVSKTYATDTHSFGTNAAAASTEGMLSTRRATVDAMRTTETTADLYTSTVARETTLASQKLSTQIVESTSVARSALVTSSNGVSTVTGDSTAASVSHSPDTSSLVSRDVESTITPASTSQSAPTVSETTMTGRGDGTSPTQSPSTTHRVSVSYPHQMSTEVDLTSLTSTEDILTPSSGMESSSIIPTSDVIYGSASRPPPTTSPDVIPPDFSTTPPKVLSTLPQVMESSTEMQSTTSVDQKFSTTVSTTAVQNSKTSSSLKPISTSTNPVSCRSLLCQNGGTCREVPMPGAVRYTCDCPFRFGGSFCEQELTIFFPSFDGDGYLEHGRLGLAGYASGEVFLSFVSRSGSGLLLFSESIPTSSSDDYLYLYLQDWRVSAEISCGYGQILRVHSDVTVDSGEHVGVLLRQTRPAGVEFVCKLEIEVKGQVSSTETVSFIYPQPLGPLYVAGLPRDFSPHTSAPVTSGLVGCVRYLQVNSVEYNVYGDAVDGRNVGSCMLDEKCQYEPCRNNGTCVSLTTGTMFMCLCKVGYSGLLCEHRIHFCWPNPCHAGATCVPLEDQESFVCLCPYGRFGLTCNETLAVSRPLFAGTVFGHASHLQYARVLNWDFVLALRLKFALANSDSAVMSNWLLYSGQRGQGYRGSDYIALGIQDSFLRLQFDLGTGAAFLRSPQPLNLSLPYHTLQVGRHRQVGWLQVDNQVNVSATTQGHLIGLNTYRDLFIGGLSSEEGAFLPDNLSFQNGFQGCIYDLEVKAGRYGDFSTVGEPPGHVDSAINVGQCSLSECALSECRNGATCVDLGASYRCECTSGWKGPLCEDKINACSPEHDPPPLCSEGSLCVLQAVGYACLCPLGKTGRLCTFEHSISDPLFRGDWSFMSFAVTSDIRFETNIELEFKAIGHSGLLFYTAQSLRPDAGDFISIALVNRYVEFRFSLDGQSDPAVVKTSLPLDLASDTWHSVEVGRFNQLGVLRVGGEVLRISAPGNLISLDVGTDFLVGGTPDLSSVNPLAVENEVLGFEGCIRRVSVNGIDLELTVNGAKDGRNIGDCDGTGCGSAVCRNNGTCLVQGLDMQDFMCLCQPPFEGETCSEVTYCSGHLCGDNGTCVPRFESRDYTCVCDLGWTGPYCNQLVTFSTNILLSSRSSLLFVDEEHNLSSDATQTNLSISFKTLSEDGLLLWVGSPEIGRTRDYLALGVDGGRVKVGIHLGHDSSTIINHIMEINDGNWHNMTVLRFSTVVSVYVDEELPVTLDVGGSYSSLDTEGHYHFGGFGINGDVSALTGGLFDSSIEGCVRNVKYGKQGTFVDFSKARYGYQIDPCL